MIDPVTMLMLILIRFINTISQLCHEEPPPELNGGIIADPMGLGKTLTMIAMAAMDVDTDKNALADEELEAPSRHIVRATLVIVPPSRECFPTKISNCLLTVPLNFSFGYLGRTNITVKANARCTRRLSFHSS